jgi:hypothetical protein
MYRQQNEREEGSIEKRQPTYRILDVVPPQAIILADRFPLSIDVALCL